MQKPSDEAMVHRRSHPSSSSTKDRSSMQPPPPSKPNIRYLLIAILFPLAGLLILATYYGYHAIRELQPRGSYAYTYEITNEYPHDSSAFTQGLVYGGNNTLYESTGLYSKSSVRIVDVQTGKVRQQRKMDDNQFGEGLTLLDGRLFQVTWLTNLGLIYGTGNLTLLSTFQHPMKDGWGLTTDGESLIGSDGTATLYFINPNTFKEQRRVVVKDHGKDVQFLNELEYVKNEIWANVWQSDCIARIAPDTGSVLGWILLSDMRHNLIASGYMNVDVLNGIAWDEDQDRLFVTGKFWPKMYEIKVHRDPKNSKEDAQKKCFFH